MKEKEKKDIKLLIGAQIQAAREAAGLTQERLAELIDMGPKNLSDVERGVVGISLNTLKTVCEVLSISPDEILFGNGFNNDTDGLIARLNRLPPEQFSIAMDIINKLFEAFASSSDPS